MHARTHTHNGEERKVRIQECHKQYIVFSDKGTKQEFVPKKFTVRKQQKVTAYWH